MDADAGRHRPIVKVGDLQLDAHRSAAHGDSLAHLVAPWPAITTAADEEGAGRLDLPRPQIDLPVDGRAVDEVAAQRDGPPGDLDGRRLDPIAPRRHDVAAPHHGIVAVGLDRFGGTQDVVAEGSQPMQARTQLRQHLDHERVGADADRSHLSPPWSWLAPVRGGTAAGRRGCSRRAGRRGAGRCPGARA